MRHDRIGPEHAPTPVDLPKPGLWTQVLARLRPARAAAAAPAPAVIPAQPAIVTRGDPAMASFHARRPALFRPSLADPRPVLFGTADPAADLAATGFMQDAGLDVVACASLRSALARAHGQPMGWSTLILSIDGFGGPRLVAEGLMALRRRLPRLPVILVSEEVRFHDFSTERLALCDVTLRGPLSAPALELALAEAPVNNLVWQARLAGQSA